MSDEVSKERITRRATEARYILEHDLMKEGFAELEKAFLAKLKSMKMEDDVPRFRATVALNILDALKGHLRTVMELGEMPDLKLQDEPENKRGWSRLF